MLLSTSVRWLKLVIMTERDSCHTPPWGSMQCCGGGKLSQADTLGPYSMFAPVSHSSLGSLQRACLFTTGRCCSFSTGCPLYATDPLLLLVCFGSVLLDSRGVASHSYGEPFLPRGFHSSSLSSSVFAASSSSSSS